MSGRRVLVCGGRDYADRVTLFRVLDMMRDSPHGIGCIIHGAARGADALAGAWAAERGIECVPFPADWNGDGRRAAGPIRNSRMLAEGKPDIVVAFPGGNGTADMVRKAEAAGVRVVRVV
jgi:hypothetical protein